MKVEYGLLKTKFEEEETTCATNNCGTKIKYDYSCFVDIDDDNIYCLQCGKCMRYERKKEKERNDLGIYETPLIKGLDY